MTRVSSSTQSGGLGGIAARGALVTVIGQGLKIAIQMVSIVVMARILSPSDYGLVAMVAVVLSLGEVFRDFGLSAAAVQAPTLTRGQRDNLFWANTGIGFFLAFLAFVLSGAVAHFYEAPETAKITQALAVVFAVNGLSAQYRASLARALRFRTLASIDVSAQAVAAIVGILLALLGFGYWSLVGMQLIQVSITLLILVAAARWLPGLPRRGQEMRQFWRFGWNLVGSQLMGFMTNNIDTMVVGRRFGVEPVGVYDRAYRILRVPLGQLRSPSMAVALPILSRIQDDQTRYNAFLIRGQRVLGYSIVAALAFAAGAASPLIDLLLGSGWSEAAPLFSLFAAGGALTTVAYVGYWVYLSRGLTHRLLQYTVVASSVSVASILIGSNWGVIGVAAGVALAQVALWPFSLWWLSRVTTLPLRDLISGGVRILSMALMCAVLVRLVVDRFDGLPSILAVMTGGVVALAWYFVAGLLLPSIRADERAVFDTARLALRRS